MSSCLSGGGRAYGFELEIVKSPSTSILTSHSSSPSSTLSESSNSPIAISTRKPRLPRKRPNQTYNEAAALLSTAYPNIFSAKNLSNPCKFTKTHDPFFDESSELLLPFPAIDSLGYLLQQPHGKTPNFCAEPKVVSSCEKRHNSPFESRIQENWSLSCERCDEEDFDADSILDEEVEEGIDSIMGNLSVNADSIDEPNAACPDANFNNCYTNPMGLTFGARFEFGFGVRRGVRPLRHVDYGDWWWSPTVDILAISPKLSKVSAEKAKKKKKKKVEKLMEETEPQPPAENSIPGFESKEPPSETSISKCSSNLLLKLNYDEVLNAWSDRGSPFSDEIPGSEFSGNDASGQARLAQIDLFAENGGVREASVLRYKEKRRTRLFSKKIRYQVRKVNADRRPRMKGRFVRRSSTALSSQR